MSKNPKQNDFQMQIFAIVSGDFLMKLVWAWSYKVGSQVNIGSGYGLVPRGNKP